MERLIAQGVTYTANSTADRRGREHEAKSLLVLEATVVHGRQVHDARYQACFKQTEQHAKSIQLLVGLDKSSAHGSNACQWSVWFDSISIHDLPQRNMRVDKYKEGRTCFINMLLGISNGI